MRVFFSFVVLFILFFGSLQAQKIEGDDLIKLLGKRETSADVNQLVSQAGSDHMSSGIKLIFESNLLTQIELYNDKNEYMPEMQQYKGELPHGLTFGSNIAQCKKALGDGFETEGTVASSYVLFKDFTLGSVNAYRVNIDFQRGRINIVTLIFKEGGAVEAEEAESEKKLGLRGDDFLTLIKKTNQNLTATRIRGYLGYHSYKDRTTSQYLEEGLLVEYDDTKHIIGITFYSGGQANPFGEGKYGQFFLPMPYGVKFTDTRDIMIQKAGSPAETTGNSIIYHEGTSNLEIFFSGGKVSMVKLYLDEERDEALKEKRSGKEEAEKQRVIDARKAKEDSIKLQRPTPKSEGDIKDF